MRVGLFFSIRTSLLTFISPGNACRQTPCLDEFSFFPTPDATDVLRSIFFEYDAHVPFQMDTADDVHTPRMMYIHRSLKMAGCSPLVCVVLLFRFRCFKSKRKRRLCMLPSLWGSQQFCFAHYKHVCLCWGQAIFCRSSRSLVAWVEGRRLGPASAAICLPTIEDSSRTPHA